MRSRNDRMAVRYEDELRLFPTLWSKAGLLVLLLAFLFANRVLSDFWLLVFNYAGVAAIGAIGLNLLTGYTGQVSLGHAFFIGAGAYVAAYLGVQREWPLLAWLPASAVVGAAAGALIGPFALRLRGNYLAIITLGLVFVGEHIFNEWETVTGGGSGAPSAAPVEVFGFDFARPEVGGEVFSRNQGFFWLIWGVVLIAALLAKNLARTRPGRAMQAVRDRDLSAEVIGVSLARYKVGAFAVSSAFAAVAGSLYGALQQFVSPVEWTLVLSITYIAMVIVGGLGTIFGSVLGAIVVTAMPRVIERYSADIPGLSTGPTDDGLISVAALNVALFGLLIVLFLMLESRGLAAVWLRLKAYFRTWPFSY